MRQNWLATPAVLSSIAGRSVNAVAAAYLGAQQDEKGADLCGIPALYQSLQQDAQSLDSTLCLAVSDCFDSAAGLT